jgi:hypothetical protein
MKCYKIFFLLILIGSSVTLVFGQSNQIYMTVTPVAVYSDSLVKPAIVEAQPQEKSIAPQEQISYETKTVMPAATLSIGKATAVTTEENKNSAPAAQEKATVNYIEQKVEKNEAPPNNAAIIPK